jgi:CheY-like chemotaxis protein
MARPRLLLVEDDADARHVLASVLKATFDVVEASNGAEAIARLEADEFEVVVTDLVMPNVDGAALVDWIGANRPTLAPCTFVATAGAAGARLKAWLEAFDERRVLSKPLEASHVLEQIRAAVEARRSTP